MNKRIIFIILLILIVSVLYYINNSRKSIENYKIFYGHKRDFVYKELRNIDLLIIEASFYSKEELLKMKSYGTKVLAYVPICKYPFWDEDFTESVKDEYFIEINGKTYLEKGEKPLIDLTNKEYRDILKEKVDTFIAKGYDGIFLDTVGDIDDNFLDEPIIYNKQLNAYEDLLNDIRNDYKNIYLLQNWGFNTLKTMSYNYVDGIMWEGFAYPKSKENKWSQNRIAELKIMQKKGIDVFTVSHENKQESKKYSDKLGFINTFDKKYSEW